MTGGRHSHCDRSTVLLALPKHSSLVERDHLGPLVQSIAGDRMARDAHVLGAIIRSHGYRFAVHSPILGGPSRQALAPAARFRAP
jgi:hypothetical protein